MTEEWRRKFIKKCDVLKSLKKRITLISSICMVFVLIGIVNIFYEFILNGWIFIVIGIICCLILTLPLIIRYKYILNVLTKEAFIEGEIVKRHSYNDRTGYYYDVKIDHTNTILSTSTIFKMDYEYQISDKIICCYDPKNQEIIIVGRKV